MPEIEEETCPACHSTNVTSEIGEGTPFFYREAGPAFKAMIFTCQKCGLRYVDLIRCPECDAEVMTVTKEETFQYGVASDCVMLSILIPVHSCPDCKFQFTDQVAEILRDRAVSEHKESIAQKAMN